MAAFTRSAPTGKALSIRTARDAQQAKRRIATDVTNLVRYGTTSKEILEFVQETITAAREQ